SLEGSGDSVTLELGDDLLEASFEANGDRAWPEAAVTGWDPSTGDRFQASAGTARSGRTGNRGVTTADVGGEGRWMLVNSPVPALAHVEAEAQGALDQATAHALTVRGVAVGTPELYP